MKCKNLMKLMVMTLICAPLLTFGCTARMEMAEEGEIGEPGAIIKALGTGDIPEGEIPPDEGESATEGEVPPEGEIPAEISLRIKEHKLVRLDGTEMELNRKPIPVAVMVRTTFDQELSDEERAAAKSRFVLKRGDISLDKSFKWRDKRTLIVTPARWFDYGTTYTVDIPGSAVPEGLQTTFTTAQWGDMNGDGYSDVLVGARDAPAGAGRGYAYIFLGTENGVKTCDMSKEEPRCQPHAVIKAEADNNYLGNAMAMADVNADGFADMIIGAPEAEIADGRAYVFHGSESGVFWKVKPAVTRPRLQKFEVTKPLKVKPGRIAKVEPTEGIDLTIVEPTLTKICDLSADCLPFAAFKGANNDKLGASVGAGDVNGDGFDDIIVGAPMYGADDRGRAYVFLGSASGIIAEPRATITGISVKGEGIQLGGSVAPAGDVNNDGFDDIIVGAHRADNNRGHAYVLLGSENGIPECDVSADCIHAVIAGAASGDRLGVAVSGVGDVNKDGFDDIIVGAHRAVDDRGQAYVFYGSKEGISWTTAEPLRRVVAVKPIVEVIELRRKCDLSAGCIPGATLTGAEGLDLFGEFVSRAGDVNNDGFDDIIVGAANALRVPSRTGSKGQAYVFLGSVNGMSNCDLSAGCVPNTTIRGTDALGHMGHVSNAGDVNGDGNDDVIVGAQDAGDNSQGQAYILHGSENGIADRDLETQSPNTTLTGANHTDSFGIVRQGGW